MPLHWDQLPSWQRDNQYILSGYRTASNSFRKSFASLAYVHNKSINIYSHLIPAILLPFFSIKLHTSLTARYTSNHSLHIARIANQMDYISIVFLIVGSFIPSIFYGFYCHPILQILYITMISSLGLLCAAISAIPQFRHPTWRPFRARMFIALGLSALFPIIHGVMKFGIRQMNKQISLFWVVLQGSLYIVGACIYAIQVPECIYPGIFDIWITSHQIFHFMVVLAIISHLYGLINAFDYNHSFMAKHC
ncbi:Hly-III related protein [Aspergillus leporis]|uniref:Hly-III related protein n=1 Tax=Aspergillus leporis TaxID=41062 RepID=A0A5N5XCP8_9EURO|nr:Hly-III related protein [Aspergillus leporis]